MNAICSSCGGSAAASAGNIAVCQDCYDMLTAQFISIWGDDNDIAIREINLPGAHSMGDHLILKVGKNRSKSWVCRCLDLTGKRRDFGLGGWPDISIHEARARALKCVRAARTVPTLSQASAKCFAEIERGFTSEKHARQWQATVAEVCDPKLGVCRLDEISHSDIAHALADMFSRAPETARRTLQRLSIIFSWAFHHGLIGHEISTSSVIAMLEGRGTRFARYLGHQEDIF